jgi:ketosteroid isomerase-like protein
VKCDLVGGILLAKSDTFRTAFAHLSTKYKYEYTEKRKPTTEEGRYVTTWKRQSDSTWKLSMDMAIPET